MPRTVECPKCGEPVKLKGATGTIVCPECKKRFTIEDDEDEDRPRRRTKAGAGSWKGLWILFAVGGVLLVGGGILALVLLGGGGGGGSYGKVPANLLGYAPDDTFVLEYAAVKNQLKDFNNDKSQVRGPFETAQMERDYGPLENVVEVLKATRSSTPEKGAFVTVVVFAAPIDKARIAAGGVEREAKGVKYYQMKEGDANRNFGNYLFFPSDTMVVRSESEALLQDVLGGDAGKFPEWYRKAIADADGYVIKVVRAPRGGESLGPDGKQVRLECKWKKGDQVYLHIEEHYVNEEAAQEAFPHYDQRKRRGEEISVRIKGNRVIADHNAPHSSFRAHW